MRSYPTQQRGVSLISLMIGVAISMLGILAMMGVYQITVKKAALAGQGAATDGQRMAALFSAETLLQEAGYGLDSAAYGTDLVVIDSATLGDSKILGGTAKTVLPATGTAVVWGSRTASTYMCQGLYATATGGLVRLQAVACDSAADWDTLVWAPIDVVADTTAEQNFSVQVQKSPNADGCKTFGIAGGGGLLAVLSTTNSTDLVATGTTCLSNFPPK